MTSVTYKRQKRRPGCLVVFLIVLAIAAGLFWLSKSNQAGRFGDLFATALQDYGEDEFPEFDEIWSYGTGSNKVVRIPVTGMILLGDGGSPFMPNGSSDLALRAIRRATLDEAVLAIILEIDSGGGGITASDIIYKALLDFKQSRSDRQIVALCGDTAASGAYYIALAADHIIAHPTTVTGSIGVLVQSINVRELATKHGIKDVTIKSGENKDLLNPLSEFSLQQQAILQAVVDAMHERFVGLVTKHRDLSEDEVRPLADGRIFTATEALKLGLIDETGYWEDAMTRTAELLDVENIVVYRYEGVFSFRSLLHATKQIHPRAWLGLDQSPRLQYRWKL
jgi:protease-4